MKISINEIIDYYTNANISFLDIYISAVEPGRKYIGGRTDLVGAGLVVPISGSACFTLDDISYVIEPGMVVHAGPDMSLDREVIGDETWRFAVLHYSILEKEMIEFPFYNAHFSFPTGKNAKIMDLIQQLRESQSVPGVFERFRTKMLFTTLLAELFDSAKKRVPVYDTVLVEQVMEYIRQNYAEDITISQTAKEFAVDRRKLARVFERYIGMSPSSYLIEFRMLKAKELLRTCNCTVKQIAECVGYPDSLYFSKAFKKQTGVSPIEYRERMKYGI